MLIECCSVLFFMLLFFIDVYCLRFVVFILFFFVLLFVVILYMFVKGVIFGIGFGFFGDFIIFCGLDWFNRIIFDWKKLLEL